MSPNRFRTLPDGRKVPIKTPRKARREPSMQVHKIKHPSKAKFQSVEGWTLTFFYKNKKSETVQVVARDSDDALAKALKVRRYRHVKPRRIEIVDPSLKEVIATIGTGMKKAAKMTGKGIKAGIRVTGQVRGVAGELKREYKVGRVTSLVKDAFSDNPARRIVAIAELRKKYPNVYKNLGLKKVGVGA